MEQVIMKNGVNHVIDNIEKVEERMSRIGINASVEQIKKNVREDDIFYFTDMLESKIPSDRSVFFSWINTGFSYSNEPVFVSLVRNQDEFCGHFVGTPSFLVEGMKKTFEYKPRETKELYQNLQKLKKRYMSKNVNDVENAVLVYSDDNNNAVEEELERKILPLGQWDILMRLLQHMSMEILMSRLVQQDIPLKHLFLIMKWD